MRAEEKHRHRGGIRGREYQGGSPPYDEIVEGGRRRVTRRREEDEGGREKEISEGGRGACPILCLSIKAFEPMCLPCLLPCTNRIKSGKASSGNLVFFDPFTDCC
ncbi:hypothetical protein ALC56_08326 [Trachymyrmex septentrionalis]|uniref:Uncharacterized protein n=1 Tax=Trachymyrmex septentrionalis TaxID=34720 RepID=A0A195FB55_9HYME|nr:hypothetical protein ALC56_08326 [Trachymyrmex septentrionalis]